MSLLRLAVVGCGAVTTKAHLPAMAAVAECELVALVDPDPQSRARALEVHRALGSRSDVFDRASVDDILDDFDAAIVAAPPAHHFSIAQRILLAGKSVLVEKPLAPTTEECDELIAVANRSSAVLAVGHQRRAFPSSRFVKEILDQGALGAAQEVRFVDGYAYSWPVVTPAVFTPSAAGGGVLADVGPHVLDLLGWWFGDGLGVVEYEDDSLGGLENEAWITLQGRGTLAHVELSRIRSLGTRCTIRGTAATLQVRMGMGRFSIERSNGVVEEGLVPGNERYRRDWTSAFADQLTAFVAAVRREGEPLADGVAGRRAVSLIASCYPRRRRRRPAWLAPARPRSLLALAGARVAVVGASGFVGSRLVERLVLESDADVVAVVPAYARLARLATLPRERLRFAAADGGLGPELARAIAGCACVVHCDSEPGTDEDPAWEAHVAGAEAAYDASARAGVRRFVYLSSLAVHELGGRIVDERTPLRSLGPEEAPGERVRLVVERKLRAASDIETVIVRPGPVYGPWTRLTEQALAVAGGDLRLPLDGRGVSNVLFVDDLVSALASAAATPGLGGEAFVLAGPDTVSWSTFFASHRKLLRARSPQAGSEDGRPPPAVSEPTGTARCSIGHARRRLGFEPAFSLADGMQTVGRWADWMGLL